MKTILITAYAINPYKGSENGSGWRFLLEIAKAYKVIAITRENNLPEISRYLSEHDVPEASNLEFVGFDLPKYQRFWKRGNIGAMPYYTLWQWRVAAFIRKQDWQYDLVHNLNFNNDWAPSYLGSLGKPFIWGPIGHHPKIPRNYLLPVYGWKAYLADRGRWLVKQIFWKFNPALRRCIRQADVVMPMNLSVAKVLPVNPKRYFLMPSAGTESVPNPPIKKGDSFEVISVGRFVALKGFDVTIRSFARFFHQQTKSDQNKLKLTLVGKGPTEPMLRNLTKELGIEAVTEFVNWMPRTELMARYRQASLFFFPSHEGAGMVVPEAMSYGLPVLCFDNCGPGEFISPDCGHAVPYGEYDQSIGDFADQLQVFFLDPERMEEMSQAAYERFLNYFDWQAKGKRLRSLYREVLGEKELIKA